MIWLQDDSSVSLPQSLKFHLILSKQCFNSALSVKSKQPFTEGYIAVILPKFEESKSITENLLSREEFESVVSKRTVAQSQPSWWELPVYAWSQNCSATPTRLGEDWGRYPGKWHLTCGHFKETIAYNASCALWLCAYTLFFIVSEINESFKKHSVFKFCFVFFPIWKMRKWGKACQIT